MSFKAPLFYSQGDPGGGAQPPAPQAAPPEPPAAAPPKPGNDDVMIPKARFDEANTKLKETQDRLAQLEAAENERKKKKMEEDGKINELLAQTQKELDNLKMENTRLQVAQAKNLPAELVDRLKGTTKEELEADADKLLAFVKAPGKVPGVPPVGAGGAPVPFDVSKATPEEIRKARQDGKVTFHN